MGEMEPSFGDARHWDEASYRAFLRAERVASTRTVFAARLAPSSDQLLAVASSDGSVCMYSIPTSVPYQPVDLDNRRLPHAVDPLLSLSGHSGPAYDLQFCGDGDDAILLSCGDDGRIHGWHWGRLKSEICSGNHDGLPKKEDFVLNNPQLKGPKGSLAPISETNAIATNPQEGHIYSATGSGHAYCWDIEREMISMTFEGHSDYLHCICSQPSQKQVITGSEDGTIRIWDCRNPSCIAVLDPCEAIKISKKRQEKISWVSCVAVDSSGKWMVSGTGGHCLTLWSLLSFDAVTRISTLSAPQAVTIANDQIITVGSHPYLSSFTYSGDVISQVNIAPSSAFSLSVYPSGVSVVGGYAGLVDIVSEFGSHICTFKCK